ncbi:hypothetical protein CAEBREN_29508 [Caenorhabditis brenneri]|uniref:SXP/RAL-2 family protein Ani s 5-like cation-binding domain-containing protein n=1 Tax=Caenorhabditis brenneri TaxID=135651 RepID=G0P6V8_CAEBE|nr:hypothetical protein CAEBREN_29508 [Caenorhabditis brenneri]
MALQYNLIFAVLALSAVVLAGPGGRHGHGHGGQGGHGGPQLPPFLQNVTSEGRQAFMAIVTNTSLTIAETETQITAWAQTYGVTVSSLQPANISVLYSVLHNTTDLPYAFFNWKLKFQSKQYERVPNFQAEVNEFKTQVETTLNQVKANVTAVINNLSTVQTQLEAIFANKSQTVREQFQAIEQLKQQYPKEIGVLFFLAMPKGGFGGFGGQGGQGPFGGFPGNQGGFPGGNQGGFPGNQGGFPGNQGGNQGGFGGFPGGNQGGFPGNQGGNQGGFGGQQRGRGGF